MLDVIKVGQKLKDTRLKNKLSQEEIANKIYVTRQAVSNWEMGISLPTIDSLIMLTKIYHSPIEELLCLDEDIILKENIFEGHSRDFIIKQIIERKLKVDLVEVFYQFSKKERRQIIRAIKDKKIIVDRNNFMEILTKDEKNLLFKKRKGVKKL